MPFSHDEAKLIAGYQLATYERERVATQRVIAAIPDSTGGYSPDPKSMPALQLAWHIASTEKWFLEAIINSEFGELAGSLPESIQTGSQLAAWYEAEIPPLFDRVKALSGAALVHVIDFHGMLQWPALEFLSLSLRHGIHHRGQLSAYLRPMGAKVPSIYGPSGDTD